MELSQQIISLELSKRLKELGVKQESYFCYSICTHCLNDNEKNKVWDLGEYEQEYSNITTISAFTVAELGEMLPNELDSWCGRKKMRLRMEKYEDSKYHISYEANYFTILDEVFIDKNEANARA